METFEILEVGMLLCFGFAWPFNIVKSYKSRTNTGKSLLFLIVIWLGYLLGIFHKLFLPNPDFVLWFYFANILLVSVDIALYYRNKVITDRQKQQLVE
jgi:hypothetical protein